MTLDLLHDLANTEVFCLFYNCMWQSRHSELNVYFIELSEQTGWLSIYKSLRSWVCDFTAKQDILSDLPSKQTRWLLTLHRSHRAYNWVFDFGWVCLESFPPPATSESNSFIQLSLKVIFGGSRGDAYTFSYMISPYSIITVFGIQYAGSVSWKMIAFDLVW